MGRQNNKTTAEFVFTQHTSRNSLNTTPKPQHSRTHNDVWLHVCSRSFNFETTHFLVRKAVLDRPTGDWSDNMVSDVVKGLDNIANDLTDDMRR